MKNHSKAMIKVIICAILPFALMAQMNGLTLEHRFKPMSEKEIRTQIALLDIENIGSAALAVGGAVFAYEGALLCILGWQMITSEPIFDFDNIFWIFPFLQYSMGAIMFVGGPFITLGGLEIAHIFSDNIKNNIHIRRNFKLELKQFTPTSYNDRPGIGIGFSVALN